MPIYKFPYVSIAVIFLPLWLLAIINLVIFFQENNLAERVASISTVMIALVALIPTVRSQIPPYPKIVFIEFLVYAITSTSLLVLLESLSINGITSYQFDWHSNGLYISSLIITISSVFIILVMMFLHHFKWLKDMDTKW